MQADLFSFVSKKCKSVFSSDESDLSAVKKAFVISWALFLLASACKGTELPALRGRYLGEMKTQTQKTKIVSQVSDFTFIDGAWVLRFEVFEVSVSAVGTPVHLSIQNRRHIKLTTPLLPSSDVLLDISGSCARGISADKDILLCWKDKAIDLNVSYSSPSASTPTSIQVLSLHLELSDEMDFSKDALETTTRTFSLEELVGRAKFQSYAVRQEAERVYQARENIRVQRGNLLPKLSLRSIVGAFTGDYLSVIGNALPFLFPSNWYQWKIAGSLAQAERHSFSSLRGNQMNAVEGLFYLIHRDQSVLAELNRHLMWMKKTQSSLLKEEQAGVLPTGSADYYGTTIALIDRDRIALQSLIKNEYGDLAHTVALRSLNGISGLKPLELPSLDQTTSIDAETFFKEAQAKSLEIKTLNSLLTAASFQTRDVFFQWLNPEGSGALGFGTAAQFRIGRSREAEIRSKMDETLSVIEQKSAEAANEYNTALENHALAKKNSNAVQTRLNWLMKRHLTGDATLDKDAFIDQLTDLQLKMIGFNADRISSTYSWMIANSKINRLRLQGFYQNIEAGLPTGAALNELN